ncbi:MAG: hypothetical protein ABRQ37_24240 [Candidatus Eremiobacterota bacterium]
MPEIPLKFKTDPEKDISGKQEEFYFGQKAVKDTVGVSKTGGSGLESYCSKVGTLGDKTETDGTVTCKGVRYSYTIKSQQKSTYYPTFTGTPVDSYTYHEGEIEIRIAWETYTAPPPEANNTGTGQVILEPPSSEPAEVASITPQVIEQTEAKMKPMTTEEWIEQQKVLRDGFNVKFVHKHYKNIDKREIKSKTKIVNNVIPDREHAYKIAKKAIEDSRKDLEIPVHIVPNFKLKPLMPMNITVPFLGTRKTKIEGMELNNEYNSVTMEILVKSSRRPS